MLWGCKRTEFCQNRDQLTFDESMCALNLLNAASLKAEIMAGKIGGTSVSVVLHRQRPGFH